MRFSAKVFLFLISLAMGLVFEWFASSLFSGAYMHHTDLPVSEFYYQIVVSLLWFLAGIALLLLAKLIFWPPKENEIEA